MTLFQRVLRILKYAFLGFLGLIGLFLLGLLLYFLCFNSVRSQPKGSVANPSLAAYDLETWETQKVDLKQKFESAIYGPYPNPEDKFFELARTVILVPALEDIATVEQITYASQSGIVGDLKLILITPTRLQTPVPVIITQNFCGNHASFPFPGIAKPVVPYPEFCEENMMSPVVRTIMGEHLMVAPIRRILESGYALAGFYPAEIVPDDDWLAPIYLDRFAENTGAIITWAWGFNRVAEALNQDGRLDATKTAVWGHSRHGKAALVAAAFEDQIDLVISHQSGTGGASLNKSGIGESIKAITTTYPFWFSPNYQKYANDPQTMPVDQHQLIALAAPTPILLGNGQHDKWSDPQSAWQALQGATPIYELYGATGLNQPDLLSPNFDSNLVFHMRPGPHGTRVSDWQAFLDFLAGHFQ